MERGRYLALLVLTLSGVPNLAGRMVASRQGCGPPLELIRLREGGASGGSPRRYVVGWQGTPLRAPLIVLLLIDECRDSLSFGTGNLSGGWANDLRSFIFSGRWSVVRVNSGEFTGFGLGTVRCYW
jgi:hypothetical protein